MGCGIEPRKIRHRRGRSLEGNMCGTGKSALTEERRPRSRRSVLAYANRMLWFFRGHHLKRWPVDAKIELSTAGAATKIVGAPTPPQSPPDGMMMHSTFGISLRRIES